MVIEIIYKGNHYHDPTQKARCSKYEFFPPGVAENVELAISDDHIKNDPKGRIKEVPQITVQPAITNPGHGDGYKWRKYGQKMVKGNPNPRSYYRCTHKDCRVQKHVEKSLDNANILVITFKGRHDHQKPDQMNKNVSPSTTSLASAATAVDFCNASNKSGDVELRSSSSSAKESEITEGNTSEVLESTEENASEVLESAETLVKFGTCLKSHELELYSDATNLEALSSDTSQATQPEPVLRSVSEASPNFKSWRYYCEKRSLEDDDYNWYKYGEKRVKSTDCLRSYYRCTHSNCLVKRSVEKNFVGVVSKILYKGQHNHEPTEKVKCGITKVLPPNGPENARPSNNPKDRQVAPKS